MSFPDYANVPVGSQQIQPLSFVNAAGTALRALIDGSLFPQTAGGANGALPPAYYGGVAALDLHATSSDTAAKDVLLYEGTVVATQGASTSTLSTTATMIVRATGDWAAEGRRVGDQVVLMAPTNGPANAQDGIVCLVSAVTATTLTVTGLSVNGSLIAGTRLVLLKPLGRFTIPAGAGTNGAASPVDLLTTIGLTATLKTDRRFGVNDMLLAGMQSAVTAGYAVSLGGNLARF